MSELIVDCVKLLKSLPGPEKPPFGGDLGKQIFEKVSKEAWLSWKNDMQIKVLNEYRLNMGDPKDYETLVKQMVLYLNLESGAAAEVGNADRGRS